MNKLLKLFSILQLTKEQPLTGYLPAGIKGNELPSLAEHHYTAAIMGWLIVQRIKQAGGIINERKVIIMLLMHDLGELFGGDIAGPLNRKYPDLREFKDRIGERAMLMLSTFLDDQTSDSLEQLWLEFEAVGTDEAVVAKIMDQMDHQFFLEHHNYKKRYNSGKSDYRRSFTQNHIYKLTDAIINPETKKVMKDFLDEFFTNYFERGYQTMTFLMDEEEST